MASHMTPVLELTIGGFEGLVTPFCGFFWQFFGNIVTEWSKAPNFAQSFLSIRKVILEGVPSLK